MMAGSRPPSPRRRRPAVLSAPPGRRSRDQGRWSLVRAPVTGWTDRDRGPPADAEERTRSAHRAIDIREKRRRVLSSRPVRITFRVQPTSSVSSGRPPCTPSASGRAERPVRHGIDNHRPGRPRHIETGGRRAFPRIVPVTQRHTLERHHPEADRAAGSFRTGLAARRVLYAGSHDHSADGQRRHRRRRPGRRRGILHRARHGAGRQGTDRRPLCGPHRRTATASGATSR